MSNMYLTLLVLLASLLCSSLAVSVPFKTCGQDAHFSVNAIEADVWPPNPNRFALNIAGKLEKDVMDGRYETKLNLNGQQVWNDWSNIGETTPLPWQQGEFSMVYSRSMPQIVQHASYSLELSAVDHDNQVIFCVSMWFDLESEIDGKRVSSPIQRLAKLAKAVDNLAIHSINQPTTQSNLAALPPVSSLCVPEMIPWISGRVGISPPPATVNELMVILNERKFSLDFYLLNQLPFLANASACAGLYEAMINCGRQFNRVQSQLKDTSISPERRAELKVESLAWETQGKMYEQVLDLMSIHKPLPW